MLQSNYTPLKIINEKKVIVKQLDATKNNSEKNKSYKRKKKQRHSPR